MFRRRSALALTALAACASTLSAEEAVELGRRGEVQALVAAWDRAESDRVRGVVLEQVALHPGEHAGRVLVGQQLKAGASEGLKLAALRAAEPYAELAPELVELLGDPLPQVRELAADVLQRRADSAGETILRGAEQGASHLVRAGCARLLSTVAIRREDLRPRAEEALLALAARDDAARVREQAVAALGALALPRARPALLERLRTDPDPSVRLSAERALAKLGEAALGDAVVAVLPLKNDTGDAELDRLARQVADYVAARLTRERLCRVVEPEKMKRALDELKKRGALLYDGDDPNAPELGRFRIANQLVYGSLQRQGQRFTIVLARMDVATLAQVPGSAVAVQGYRVDLDELKVRAADQLVAGFR